MEDCILSKSHTNLEETARSCLFEDLLYPKRASERLITLTMAEEVSIGVDSFCLIMVWIEAGRGNNAFGSDADSLFANANYGPFFGLCPMVIF